MSRNYLKLMALIIPNLFWVYTTSEGAFRALSERREAFGSPDLYLDIRFVGVPQKKVKDKATESHDFDGTLATDDNQNIIRGRRVKVEGVTWYTFYFGDKKFLGWLRPGKNGCEPQMQYQVEREGRVVKSGFMKAGFCS